MAGKPGGIHARCDHRRRIGRRHAGSSLAHVTWGLRNPDDPKHAVAAPSGALEAFGRSSNHIGTRSEVRLL